MQEFSIVIPTRNRAQPLQNCLRALTRLDANRGHFEVIVVDDDGRTSLGEALAPWRECLDITLLHQPHAGPAAARNKGAAHARGQYLVFTDDDCMPAPTWLHAIASHITPTSAVGGPAVNALPQNVYAVASDLLVQYLFAYYNRDPNLARFLSSNNLAVSAEQFRALGGFDERFTRAAAEDREFCARWLERGYTLNFAPDVIVQHAHELNLVTFWRQHFNYGRGAFQYRRLAAQRRRARIQFEPRSFYRNLLRAPFASATGIRARRLLALLGIAQCAIALGFARELLRIQKST